MTKTAPVLALLCSSMLCTGCAWLGLGAGERNLQTTELGSEMNAADVVAHLNDNTSRVSSWRSTDVDISTKGPLGVPVTIGATMAVQAPQNFRLVASSLRGNEADIGSNHERFWMWFREAQPQRVMTVKHTDVPELQQQLQMPIRPDWIMHALGVASLDPAEFHLDRSSRESTHYILVGTPRTEGGRRMTRVLEVDKRTGLLTRQRLTDALGNVIASAEMSNHRTDRESGATMPHKIKLSWPSSKVSMTMRLGEIDLNCDRLSDGLWQVPAVANAPVLDLSEALANARVHGVQPNNMATPMPAGPSDGPASIVIEDNTPTVPLIRRELRSTDVGFGEPPASIYQTKGDATPGRATTSPFDSGNDSTPEWARPRKPESTLPRVTSPFE